MTEVSEPVRRVSIDREKFGPIIVPAVQGTTQSSFAGFDVPTALDTRELINAAVRSVRRDAPSNVILVLTDQPLSVRDDRVIEVAPTKAVRNARIVTMAARESPAAQVMVRLGGGEGLRAAKLRVTSGGQRVERDVQLPESGERDEFIDVDKLGASVRADLLIDDDQPADNTAWLAREANWPRIESRIPLPAYLQRMVDVYAKQRPPSEGSTPVAIVAAAADLPADGPGVVIPQLSLAAGTEAAAQPVIADHPVTKDVIWADVGRPTLSAEGPPVGWTPLVSVGGKVWVAARQRSARAIWGGLDTSEWSRSPAFVVFWGNVFNWIGAGGERFESYPVGSLDDSDWKRVELAGLPPGSARPEPKLWPGLYQRSDGTFRALNAPDVPFPPPPAKADWQDRLAAVEKQARQVDLAPVLAAAALVCLALAASTWKRKESSRPVMA
jgi:hypothetical protein